MTFTQEQLIEKAKENVEFFRDRLDLLPQSQAMALALRLAEITLAALTAPVVGWTDAEELRNVERDGCGYLFKANPITPHADPLRVIKLYTAQPALQKTFYLDGIVAAAESEVQRHELSGLMPDFDGIAMSQRECFQAGLEVGKSRAIPDGWVMVPIIPTEDMIINGFESVPDPHFSDEKEWEEYEALSGCQQAVRRAELCWVAMIKAAPQQDVKSALEIGMSRYAGAMQKLAEGDK